ncbi:MAG: TlpA disulfide reductase family protein [Haloarculaceae archaeon]
MSEWGDPEPAERTRRRLLRGVAAAGAAGLAGCTGLPGRGADGGGGPSTAGAADDSSRTPTSADDRDVIRLETLAVGGSPGEQVALRPPDRPALLDFFATWCAPCIPQMETLREVRSTFAPAELGMVSVTSEADESAVRGFWREHDGTWPVATDPRSRAVREYSVTGVPTLVVVLPDGTVTWRHTGLAGRETLLEQVRRALE